MECIKNIIEGIETFVNLRPTTIIFNGGFFFTSDIWPIKKYEEKNLIDYFFKGPTINSIKNLAKT